MSKLSAIFRSPILIGVGLAAIPLLLCICLVAFILIPDQTEATTTIPGYRITVIQRNEDFGSYYVTYFEVVRDDGWHHGGMIDSTTPGRGECLEITTYTGTKIAA
jgi:hypothetical protein